MAEGKSVIDGFTKATWIASAVAMLGLFAAIYFHTQQSQANNELASVMVQRDQVQQDLAQQREAVGTVSDLNAQIDALAPELQNLTAERESAQGDAETLLQRVEDLRNQEAELQSEIDIGHSDKAALEEELTPLREELDMFEQRKSELEQAISDQTAELAQIGERVEQARDQEAELQQAISQLTDETARLSEEAAADETRVQSARSELEEMTTTLRQSRREHEALQEEIAQMQTDAADAGDRLAALQDDIAATEVRRIDLQSIRINLADMIEQRAEELSDLEIRVGRAMEADTPEMAGTSEADGAKAERSEPETQPEDADAPNGVPPFETDTEEADDIIPQ